MPVAFVRWKQLLLSDAIELGAMVKIMNLKTITFI